MLDVTFHRLTGSVAGFVAGALCGITATNYRVEHAVQAERAEWSKCDIMIESFQEIPDDFFSNWDSFTKTPDGKLWCGIRR